MARSAADSGTDPAALLGLAALGEGRGLREHLRPPGVVLPLWGL